jgi:alkylation response protein AidB-like acyl-CoA dehydrogenase
MDVLGPWSQVAEGLPYELTRAQAMFLYTRADTIYGGSNQIQRNIIGERVLGLPPEPKVV